MRFLLKALLAAALTMCGVSAQNVAISGRYVLLAGQSASVCLNVGDLEVYDVNHNNVARASGVQVLQSGFYSSSSFPAHNLVDGNPNTFAHTSCGTNGAPQALVLGGSSAAQSLAPFEWMVVDLGSNMVISQVVVQNRRDTCCQYRLMEGVKVILLNDQQLANPAFVSNPLTEDLTQAIDVILPCPAGTFSTSASGSASCTPCPVGTFNPSVGSTTCTPCSKGQVASTPGSVVCTPCAPNTFAATTGQAQCQPCEQGLSSGGSVGAWQCCGNGFLRSHCQAMGSLSLSSLSLYMQEVSTLVNTAQGKSPVPNTCTAYATPFKQTPEALQSLYQQIDQQTCTGCMQG